MYKRINKYQIHELTLHFSHSPRSQPASEPQNHPPPRLSKGTRQHVIVSLCHQVSFSMKFRCRNRKEWWQIFPLFQQKAKEMLPERWKLHFCVITNHLCNTWCTNIAPLCVSCLLLRLGQEYIFYGNTWLGEKFPASRSWVTCQGMGCIENSRSSCGIINVICSRRITISQQNSTKGLEVYM